MTTTPKPDQDALTRLADELCEDVLNTPGEKLLAEVAEDYGHQSTFAKEFDTIFARTVPASGRQDFVGRIGTSISRLATVCQADALKAFDSIRRLLADARTRIATAISQVVALRPPDSLKAPESLQRALKALEPYKWMVNDRRAWAAAAAVLVLLVVTPVYLANRSSSHDVGSMVSALDNQQGESREDGPSTPAVAANANVQMADSSAAKTMSGEEASPAAPVAAKVEPPRPAPARVAVDSKRVALVIGNSAYQNAPALPNPVRDAALISNKLKEANFDVVDLRNVGYLPFKRALQEFQVKAERADIALIYYSGHGIQVRDRNYFVPIDARLQNEIDAEDEAVTLDRMVQAIEPAKKLKLVILDANRDNPFEKTMKRRVAMRVVTHGLGKEEPQTTDTLIAYATRQGSTTEDGGGNNSLFAMALAKHLVEPGLDIRFAFGRIRDEVMKVTGDRQEPYVAGSIGPELIALNPKDDGPRQDEASAKGDYQVAVKVGSRKAFELFVNQYKTGLYVEFAKEQIKKIDTQSQIASLSPPTAAPVQSRQPTTEEARAWDRVKDKSNNDELRAFIAKYPTSVLRFTAERQLEMIEEREARLRDESEHRAQEAARAKEAERVAALQKAEDERRAKATAAERANMDRACSDQEDRLANLKSAGNKPWVRDDLKRLERDLSCERLRPGVVAALSIFDEKPAANSPELVRSAQKELARIGCYTGAINGSLAGTKTAANAYRSRRNLSPESDITEDFVASLGKETARVCPLVCGPSAEAVGERCVATTSPGKKREPAKQQQAVRPRQEPAAAMRLAPRIQAGSGGGGGGGSTVGVGF